MGVRDAILRIVTEINSSKENILVHGPLIHNPQTIEILHGRGLRTIDETEPLNGKIVAIRTHGIPLENLKIIRKQAKRIINLTCSRVARVQGLIKRYSNNGYHTIIAGDKDHAEVIALKSYAQGGVTVISSIRDIRKLPKTGKYLVVSQTTFDGEQFIEIVEMLRKRLTGELQIINTICDSTNNRQIDVIEAIKSGINVLIVVGGKNSANTKRLANLGLENRIRTYHIETELELDENSFKPDDCVFVTAGASTPGWIINNVLEKLYLIKFKNSNPVIDFAKKFLEFITRTNIVSASAAFFVSLFTCSGFIHLFNAFHK